MLPVKIEGALWYEFDQNNSGGYFERDDFVSDVVFVQAMNADQAETIMRGMIDNADAWNWCECCGERWSFWRVRGYEVPTRYESPVTDGVDLYSRDGYILFHGLNGRTLKWSGKLDDTPTEIGRIEAGE
ncbi:hypothetical protein PJKIFABJ_00021 [Pseudomonas phage PE09]|uniref:DUF7296 domain-containing protein n=2 Tax=Otagovirus TaxID=2560197 RepID=A0A7S8BD54_9CAUD|nr:hypothetical protein QGX22_gp021 [Pseudomonas phage PE09]YP_010768326.1 hypothetical protein QGX23_gp018 [Pseudomonas phage PN09]QHZ59976.1 hypothetical protein PJKIFABJ_00021 [Pseudomonas phage PE09]QPB10439.1 hypothetical protein PN09_018 [Pseudomonas phage PN09]